MIWGDMGMFFAQFLYEVMTVGNKTSNIDVNGVKELAFSLVNVWIMILISYLDQLPFKLNQKLKIL